MGKPMTALDQPALRDHLATLPPDAELARLAEAFAATIAPLAEVRVRPRQIRERIAGIDAALIDAGAAEAGELLIERARLAAELASLPVKAETLARRYAAAELGYLRRAHHLVVAELQVAEAELAPLLAALGATQARELRLESTNMSGPEKFERLAALGEEVTAQRQAAAAPKRRADAARYALSVVGAIVAQKYDEGLSVAQEGAHALVAEAYGRRVVRALQAA